MVEVCQHHSELVESVGEIKGTVNMIHEAQKKMCADIDELCKSLSTNEKNSAVEKIKIKPIYAGIGIIALIAVTKIGEKLIEWIAGLVR